MSLRATGLAFAIALVGLGASEQVRSQAAAGPAQPGSTPAAPDHESRSPAQAELAAALERFPIDHDLVLGLIGRLGGSLSFSVRGRCGDTPIVAAARRGDLELVRAMLDHGVGIDDRLQAPAQDAGSDEDWACPGNTALMGSVGFADERESAARIARVEAAGHAQLAQQFRDLDDPERHLQVTRFLLDRKANVNLRSGREGVSALALAIRGHHRKAARLLFERGASADVRSETGRTGDASGEVVVLQGADWSILSLALADAIRSPQEPVDPDDLDLARRALEHGASQRDKDRVLEAAWLAQHSTVARLLLQSGADPNRTTSAGRFGRVTLLARTIEQRRWEDAELLVRSGASPNACAREVAGATCDATLSPGFLPSTRMFTSAMLLGAPAALLRLMLDKGAHLQAVDQTGRTALQAASGSCLKDGRVMSGSRCPADAEPPTGFDKDAMVRFLLENGAVADTGSGTIAQSHAAAEAPKATAPAPATARRWLGADRMGARVIDQTSGQPIAGAIVVVDWTATAAGLVESREVCLHTDAARTDAQGRYEMDDWSGYPLFLYDRARRIKAFRFGYEVASVNDQTVYMKPIPPSADRWRVVEPCYIDFGDDTRAEFRKTRRHFYALYATMAKDLASAADSDGRKTVLERLRQQAESCLVDYSKPVMLNRYGLDVNVDPKDTLPVPAGP